MTAQAVALAAALHQELLSRRETLAVAESLTGGAVGAALTAVPGVSATFRGGVTAYATELKTNLLGVDPVLLARVGAADAEVALQMAVGVRERLSATYGLATTGVAGPDPADGHRPGAVHLAMAGPAGATTRSLILPGDRAAVRSAAVQQALSLALDLLATGSGAGKTAS